MKRYYKHNILQNKTICVKIVISQNIIFKKKADNRD